MRSGSLGILLNQDTSHGVFRWLSVRCRGVHISAGKTSNNGA